MSTLLPPQPELDYQTALAAFNEYAFPRKALADALARGELIRVKKGLYVQTGRGIPPYSREVLANMLYGPSYVSFDFALAWHGLTPEHVEQIQSATTGKSKIFETPIGRFAYTHLPLEYYRTGYSQKRIDEQRMFLIAEPEKALMDRILLERGLFSRRAMKEFLFDSLRIDEEQFRQLDTSLMAAILRTTSRRNLQVVLRLKEGLS